jgi:beta-mannanase
MKLILILIVLLFVTIVSALLLSSAKDSQLYCFTGAFLADKPSQKDIREFETNYGKKPFLVMIFADWGNFIDKNVIRDVYSENCILFITLEPWKAYEKQPIDYENLLKGGDDSYIKDFAKRLKDIKKPVFIRFAHEMNGNWYPWSGTKIGAEKYIAMYRRVKDIFDDIGADNAKWVFSVNREDVPSDANNHFMRYYPGDEYVDYVGIDGYNWGNTQTWSKWMTFKEIFSKNYEEIITKTNKPVMISEFSSATSGGDKKIWIKEAMIDIKKWNRIKAFVLFNVNKEADWSFPAGKGPAKEFKSQLGDPYFRDSSSQENP